MAGQLDQSVFTNGIQRPGPSQPVLLFAFSALAYVLTSAGLAYSEAQASPRTDSPDSNVSPSNGGSPDREGPGQSTRPRAVKPTAEPKGFVAVIAPARAVNAAAPRAGIVKALDVGLGQSVSCGSRVAALESGALHLELASGYAALAEAKAEASGANVALARATYEVETLERLRESSSEKERHEAVFDQQMAQEQLRRAQARVEFRVSEIRRLEDLLARSEVHAPFDGQVAACYLTPGAVVQRGTPLVRLIAKDDLIIRFAAPASELPDSVRDSLVCFRDTEHAVRVTAKVTSVSPEIEPALEMVIVEARPDRDTTTAGVVPGLAGFVTPGSCSPASAAGAARSRAQVDHHCP